MNDTVPSSPTTSLNLNVLTLDSLPSWVIEALGLKRDLNGGQSCTRDLQVLWKSETDEWLLVPTFCRKRTCPVCAAIQGRNRIERMQAAIGAIKRPTHIVLTVPNRGCRPGCLSTWLRKLTLSRRHFLRRGQKHRSLGTIPVPNWYLWKIEVTYSKKHAWWHPHLHLLCDDWITRPYPDVLRKPTQRATLATIASFLRLRWADCLRLSGLPTPQYRHEWAPGDPSPPSLANLVKIVSWDPSTSNRSDILHELAKYVTKPNVIAEFSDRLLDEYDQALTRNPGTLRTWQPKRGWLDPQNQGSGDWKFIGTFSRMLDESRCQTDPGLFYLGIEISDALRAQLERRTTHE